jgi:hypothetical protein
MGEHVRVVGVFEIPPALPRQVLEVVVLVLVGLPLPRLLAELSARDLGLVIRVHLLHVAELLPGAQLLPEDPAPAVRRLEEHRLYHLPDVNPPAPLRDLVVLAVPALLPEENALQQAEHEPRQHPCHLRHVPVVVPLAVQLEAPVGDVPASASEGGREGRKLEGDESERSERKKK